MDTLCELNPCNWSKFVLDTRTEVSVHKKEVNTEEASSGSHMTS